MGLQLAQAMTWPIVILVMVLVFIILFRDPISVFIRGLGNVSVKAPGVQITAVAMLAAATSARQDGDGASQPQAPASLAEIDDIALVVNRVVTSQTMRRLSDSLVLWVDDRPQNNIYERGALNALGVRITISTSTEDALNRVRSQAFDVIISDMGRPPDKQAGYTLLEQLRKSGVSTPFVIYAGSNLPEHKEMATRRGAQGSTNRPQELLELVVSAIQGSARTHTS
jgi:CheY-like chemotaxis protein